MSSSVRSAGGGGGKKYEGETIITPGDAVVKIPAGTLLKDGLTIRAVQTEKGTAIPSEVLQSFKPPAGKYFNEFDVEKVPDGAKQGKYVWRKSSGKLGVTAKISAEIGFESAIYEGSSERKYMKIKIQSSNSSAIPVSSLTGSDLIGLEVTINNKSNAYRVRTIKITGGNTLSSTINGETTNYSYTYDPSTGVITSSEQSYYGETVYVKTSNSLTKTKQETLYGFAVANQNIYPSDGFYTDGLYYALLGQVDSINIMSLSDNALYEVQDDTVYGLIEEGVIR